MPFNETLANRLREALENVPNVEEKKMFKGLTFMVDDKMCVCVSGDDMMVRFDPALDEELAELPHFRPMVMKGRAYKGFGYVSPEGYRLKKDFDFWVKRCLDFNPEAKSSKKKKK